MLGITQRRADWFIRWTRGIASSDYVLMNSFGQGLGPVMYVVGALQYERSFRSTSAALRFVYMASDSLKWWCFVVLRSQIHHHAETRHRCERWNFPKVLETGDTCDLPASTCHFKKRAAPRKPRCLDFQRFAAAVTFHAIRAPEAGLPDQASQAFATTSSSASARATLRSSM